MISTRIVSTGLGVPSRTLTNADLSKLVETSDEWIVTRTGIRERKLVDPAKGETNSSISIQAGKQALERAGVDPKELDLVICATLSPDTIMPNTASRIATGVGATQACGSFDINSACSGFLTAMHVADGLIRSGLNKKVLVVGSEVLSSFVNWQDRGTCVLFGDGAGAVLLEGVKDADPKKDSIILGSKLYHMLDQTDNLAIKGGGSRCSASSTYFDNVREWISIENGQEIFKYACRMMVTAAQDVAKQCGYGVEDLRWVVPHQANARILEKVNQLLELPPGHVFINVDRWGNTSAATVAISLAEMDQMGIVKKGDLCMLDVFGGGYTYGAMLLRW